MKQLFSLITFLFCISISSLAQITFQKAFGGLNDDWARSVIQTPSGDFIVAGGTMSFGAGSSDFYLVKTDVNGSLLYAKTYGGYAFEDCTNMQQTTDSDYILSGYTWSFGMGLSDVYLIRTDKNGDTLWTKTFGDTLPNVSYYIQQTTDSGFILTGFAGSDVYLVKTNKNGNALWNKTYGGIGDDVGYSIQQTNDKGYIIAGSTTSWGAGGYDVYLIKVNSIGDTLWTKTYGGTGDERGCAIKQTVDSAYIITAYTNSFGAGGQDVYVIKTNSNGDLLWSRTYGGTNDDMSQTLQKTNDGGYIIAGHTTSFGSGGQDIYLIKINSNGDTLWTRTYGGVGDEDVSGRNAIQQTIDGGYIIAGSTTSFGSGNQDVYLIKTDSIGNSGCNNQSYTTTVVGIPATQVHNTTTLISSVGIGNNPNTIISNGGTTTSICSEIIPTASFQANDTVLCTNDCINFTDLSNNATSWQWSFAGAKDSISTDQNPQNICYSTAGIYNVTLIAYNSGGSDTFTLYNYITVNPAPLTPIIIESHDTLFCTTNPTYISYQWYIDSALISNATDTFLIITHSDNYNVKITNTNGCSIAVGINPLFGIHGFVVNNYICLSPNPATNQLSIHTSSFHNEEVTVSLMDVLGEIMQEEKLRWSNDISMNIKNLAAGIYFLEMKTKSGSVVKRFVKE